MQKLLLILSFALFLGASSANACGGHACSASKAHTKYHKSKACAAQCMKASTCTDPSCMKNGKCTSATAAKATKHSCSKHSTTQATATTAS